MLRALRLAAAGPLALVALAGEVLELKRAIASLGGPK